MHDTQERDTKHTQYLSQK